MIKICAKYTIKLVDFYVKVAYNVSVNHKTKGG